VQAERRISSLLEYYSEAPSILFKDSANERNASLLAGYTASAAYLIKIKFKQLLKDTHFL